MEASERRSEILKLLQLDIKPVSASNLAERFEVSRQIIVGDIALLRAGGADILATPRGYLLNKKGEGEEDSPVDGYVIACRHDKTLLETELYTVIDNGGRFLNVSVEHPIYGSIVHELDIRSRFDADEFIKKVAVTGANLLCSLTDDVHLHTIRCPDAETYRRILVALKEKGIIHGGK
ncbi:transcription repressor NadR [Ruminococcaceae bacterium OttesenSCG-928-I18]|nr:transcription repressor NadR [Ruminococcaceae bacterium OttesenSCG-928-I18]